MAFILIGIQPMSAPNGGYVRAELGGHGVAAVPGLDPTGGASGRISIHYLTAAKHAPRLRAAQAVFSPVAG
jgi:hypothetical protein